MSVNSEYDPVEVSSGFLTSEQKLLVAVVRRAVWDYILHKDSKYSDKKLMSDDARRWLFSESDDDLDENGCYSFAYACAMLGLDVDNMRIRVLRLRAQDIQRLNNNMKDA